MYSKSKLIIENTALLTKTFFVFTVEMLRLHYILSYIVNTPNTVKLLMKLIESSEIAS